MQIMSSTTKAFFLIVAVVCVNHAAQATAREVSGTTSLRLLMRNFLTSRCDGAVALLSLLHCAGTQRIGPSLQVKSDMAAPCWTMSLAAAWPWATTRVPRMAATTGATMETMAATLLDLLGQQTVLSNASRGASN